MTTQDDDDEDDESSDSNDTEENGKNGKCPGVCVPDKIAEYCESYLITPGLCKPQTKCCVSRDIYPDKVPADLRIPIHGNSSTQKPVPNTTENVKENVRVSSSEILRLCSRCNKFLFHSHQDHLNQQHRNQFDQKQILPLDHPNHQHLDHNNQLNSWRCNRAINRNNVTALALVDCSLCSVMIPTTMLFVRETAHVA